MRLRKNSSPATMLEKWMTVTACDERIVVHGASSRSKTAISPSRTWTLEQWMDTEQLLNVTVEVRLHVNNYVLVIVCSSLTLMSRRQSSANLWPQWQVHLTQTIIKRVTQGISQTTGLSAVAWYTRFVRAGEGVIRMGLYACVIRQSLN